MILFSVICALLIVLALAFILPPLRHPDRITEVSTQAQANVVVYREQLAEMASDFGHGRFMTDEQLLREREELEQRLIIDLPNDSGTIKKGKGALSSELFASALAVGLTVSAILLYLMLGAPASVLQIR